MAKKIFSTNQHCIIFINRQSLQYNNRTVWKQLILLYATLSDVRKVHILGQRVQEHRQMIFFFKS